MIYAVVSDLHCHRWSTFSSVNTDGVNGRLRITLDELLRAAATLIAAGGKTLVVAGDVFHVRGAIDPEVLNPVQATIRKILDQGVDILAIPGNHDLAGNDTTELGSAVQTLAETFSTEGSMRIFNKPQIVAIDDDNTLGFVPWRSSVDQLILDLEFLRDATGYPEKTDVFIHAGIDGVIPGLPPHGLTAERLAKLGFRRVFAGHYHNHKDLGDGIYSIGATTHQTWSDVDSRAGFLLVDEISVTFHDTKAPKFVDVTGLSEEEMELAADGSYVRFRGGAMKPDEVRDLRRFFEESGARGVSIQVVKTSTVTRSTTAKSGATLDQSVSGYIDTWKDIPADVDRDEVKRRAADVLTSARTVFEEA